MIVILLLPLIAMIFFLIIAMIAATILITIKNMIVAKVMSILMIPIVAITTIINTAKIPITKIQDTLDSINCNNMVEVVVEEMGEDQGKVKAFKAFFPDKVDNIPSFYKFDMNREAHQEILKTNYEAFDILFVNINDIIKETEISNEGPIMLYASHPEQLTGDHLLKINSNSFVGFCQDELQQSVSQVVIDAPNLLLDNKEPLDIMAYRTALVLPWGKAIHKGDLSIYSFNSLLK